MTEEQQRTLIEEFAALCEDPDQRKEVLKAVFSGRYNNAIVNLTALLTSLSMEFPAFVKIKDHVRDHMKDIFVVLTLVSFNYFLATIIIMPSLALHIFRTTQ